MAGRPEPGRIADLPNVEDISFQTVDGRTLRGYKLKAFASGAESDHAQHYLLVTQGNAMLADQILRNFTGFASAGFDVYIFDYRGYGRSEGKRRLKAMVNDYGEIIDLLNSRPFLRYVFRRYFAVKRAQGKARGFNRNRFDAQQIIGLRLSGILRSGQQLAATSLQFPFYCRGTGFCCYPCHVEGTDRSCTGARRNGVERPGNGSSLDGQESDGPRSANGSYCCIPVAPKGGRWRVTG